MAAKNVNILEALADDDNGTDAGSSSSLLKALSILEFFHADRPLWSTQEILDALQVSRSTGYRYIKALASVGLLGAVGNGYYMLGPRIIELDYTIRLTDPLLRASEGVLEELVEATDNSAILCTLYQNSVICISERRAKLSPKNLFSRGQRRSLFKGAMSKVILAHLPNHRLRNVFSRRREDIEDAKLGSSWEVFRDGLTQIRSDGYVKSVGEFQSGIVGVSGPIFNGDDAIIGSVGVAWEHAEMKHIDVPRTISLVKRAAREISQRIAASTAGTALPPRAVG